MAGTEQHPPKRPKYNSFHWWRRWMNTFEFTIPFPITIYITSTPRDPIANSYYEKLKDVFFNNTTPEMIKNMLLGRQTGNLTQLNEFLTPKNLGNYPQYEGHTAEIIGYDEECKLNSSHNYMLSSLISIVLSLSLTLMLLIL